MTALPHQLVWQARQIADAHHLRVVDVNDVKTERKTGVRKLVKAWVVYRTNVRCARSRIGERVKKTSSPARLVEIVRTAAGIKDGQDEAGGAHAHP